MKVRVIAKELERLLNDISAYRDMNNDFPNRNFEGEFSRLENMALKLFKKLLEYQEGMGKINLVIIGNFSSGKSSIINSLIGENVCPTKVNPTTSSLTKFIYGDKHEIYLIDGNQKIPKSQEDYFNLCQHEVGRTERTKRYFFEYRYPSEVLRGINIYDTPGFENPKNENDDSITEEIVIKEADVVLFAQDISKPSLEEDTLKRIRRILTKKENTPWYLVLNKADITSDRDIERIKHYWEREGDVVFKNIYIYSAKTIIDLFDYFNTERYIKESMWESIESFAYNREQRLIEQKDTNDERNKPVRTGRHRSWWRLLLGLAGKEDKDHNDHSGESMVLNDERSREGQIDLLNLTFKISEYKKSRFRKEKFLVYEQGGSKLKILNEKQRKFVGVRRELLNLFRDISINKDSTLLCTIDEMESEYTTLKYDLLSQIRAKISPKLFEDIDKIEETKKVVRKSIDQYNPDMEFQKRDLELIFELHSSKEGFDKVKDEINQSFGFYVEQFTREIFDIARQNLTIRGIDARFIEVLEKDIRERFRLILRDFISLLDNDVPSGFCAQLFAVLYSNLIGLTKRFVLDGMDNYLSAIEKEARLKSDEILLKLQKTQDQEVDYVR